MFRCPSFANNLKCRFLHVCDFPKSCFQKMVRLFFALFEVSLCLQRWTIFGWGATVTSGNSENHKNDDVPRWSRNNPTELFGYSFNHIYHKNEPKMTKIALISFLWVSYNFPWSWQQYQHMELPVFGNVNPIQDASRWLRTIFPSILESQECLKILQKQRKHTKETP